MKMVEPDDPNARYVHIEYEDGRSLFGVRPATLTTENNG